MNKKEFDDKYVNNGISVCCDTMHNARDFLNLASSFGYKWRSGASFTDNTEWNNHCDEITYNLSRGTFGRNKDFHGKRIKYKGEGEIMKNNEDKKIKKRKAINPYDILNIEQITINKPAIIVRWHDKVKTVVKTYHDEFREDIGFLYAYFEKHSGLSRTQCNKFLNSLVADRINKDGE